MSELVSDPFNHATYLEVQRIISGLLGGQNSWDQNMSTLYDVVRRFGEHLSHFNCIRQVAEVFLDDLSQRFFTHLDDNFRIDCPGSSKISS